MSRTQPHTLSSHAGSPRSPRSRRQRPLFRFLRLVAWGLILSACFHLAWVQWQVQPLADKLPPNIPPPPSLAIGPSDPPPDWSRASFPVLQFDRYSSLWGWRTDPFSGQRKLHRGLDIAGPTGSPIVAWWSGKVTTVANQPEGCGNYVLIQSGEWEHLYCHNQTVLVAEGDIVQAGQPIATLGSTGKSSGPHCHFELWFAGENLDPALVFQAMYHAQRTPAQASVETPVSYYVPAPQALQGAGSDRDMANHALD